MNTRPYLRLQTAAACIYRYERNVFYKAHLLLLASRMKRYTFLGIKEIVQERSIRETQTRFSHTL